MESNRKAQSALEFLTTYAWAFIVIIIVIAAIAYFGILRPQKILPDRCNFNVGFECQAYSLTSAGGVMNLRIKNGVGQLINVTSVTLSTESGPLQGCTVGQPVPNWNNGYVVSPGNFTTYQWTGCGFSGAGFSQGDKGKILVQINYYDLKAGASFARRAEGEVFAELI